MAVAPLLRSASGPFAFEALSRGGTFLFALATARIIGPSQYGVLNYATTVAAFVALVGDGGLGELGVQRHTGVGSPAADFRAAVGGSRLTLGLVATALFAVGVLLVPGVPLAAFAAVLGVPAVIVVTNVALEGRVAERFTHFTRTTAVAAITGSAASLAVAVAWSHHAVWLATAASAATTTVAIVLAKGVRVGRPTSKQLRAGLPFALLACSSFVYTRIDRVVAVHIGGDAAGGQYSAAYTLITPTIVLSGLVYVLYNPVVLRDVREGTFSLTKVRGVALRLTAFGMAIAIAVALLAVPLVHLVLGESYDRAGHYLQILAWLAPLYLLNPFFAVVLVATGRPGTVTRFALVNLTVSAVVYGAAIGMHSVTALAWASVAIEVVGLAQALLAIWGRAGRRATMLAAGRTTTYTDP